MVSTGHLDPLDQFQKLIIQQQQPQPPNRLPKWFFPNGQSIYKYFVLLHDVQEGEISKLEFLFLFFVPEKREKKTKIYFFIFLFLTNL